MLKLSIIIINIIIIIIIRLDRKLELIQRMRTGLYSFNIIIARSFSFEPSAFLLPRILAVSATELYSQRLESLMAVGAVSLLRC
jgi:hypothetical protein